MPKNTPGSMVCRRSMAYFAFIIILIYAITALITDSYSGFFCSYLLRPLEIMSAALMISLVPGIMWAPAFFKRETVKIFEFLAAAFALSIILLIASATAVKLAGFAITRTILTADIALLAFSGLILFNKRFRQIKIENDLKRIAPFFIIGLFAFLLFIMVFQRSIFTEFDGYFPMKGIENLSYSAVDLAEYNITKEYGDGWSMEGDLLKPLSKNPAITYHNPSNASLRINIGYLVNYFDGERLELYKDSRLIGTYDACQYPARFGENAWYNFSKFEVFEDIELVPGDNTLRFSIISDEPVQKTRFLDFSNMDRADSLMKIKQNYLLVPYINIVHYNETLVFSSSLEDHLFLFAPLEASEGKGYSVQKPPLALDYHFNMFGLKLIGYSIANIKLLELIKLFLIFLTASVIVCRTSEVLPARKNFSFLVLLILFAILIYSAAVILSSDLVHAFFTLMILLASYFLLSKKNSLFLIFAAFASLTEYPGFLLVLILLFSYLAIFRDKCRVKTLFIWFAAILVLIALSTLMIGWINGMLGIWYDMFYTENLLRFVYEDFSSFMIFFLFQNLLLVKWVLIASFFVPLILVFYKLYRKDGVSKFYLLAAIIYFSVITLSRYKNLRYLLPIITMLAIPGARAISRIENKRLQKIALIIFLLLFIMSFIYAMLRPFYERLI